MEIGKTKGDGIEVNVPSEGYLRITLLPADTGIAVREYFMALQLKWSDDEVYEWK